MLLTIKESRISKGNQYSQLIHIWDSDMPAFFVGMLSCLGLFPSDGLDEAMKALRRHVSNIVA